MTEMPFSGASASLPLASVSGPSSAADVPLNARRSRLLIVALVTAEMVAIFEGSMIYAASATFYRIFGDPIAVAWITTTFLLASASTALVMGRLADLYGRRRLALIALACSVVGSLISGCATGLSIIVLGRCLQGCTSGILPICYGLLREHLSREFSITGIGIVATVITAGAGAGILVGGVIVDHFSWRGIFFASSALAALAFVLIRAFAPPSRVRASTERLDLTGAISFAAAIAAILFAISSAKNWGWHDGRVRGLFAGGIVVLTAWTIHELRIAHPLVDLRVLSRRQPALANLAMVMVGLGPLQVISFLTLLMQQPKWTGGLGISATVCGMLLLMPQSMGLAGGPLAAAMIKRRSARAALATGGLLLLTGWSAIAAYHASATFIVCMMMLACLGQAITMAAVPMLVLEAVPEGRTSEAAAVITTLRPIAMGIGTQVSAFILAGSMVRDTAHGAAAYPAIQGFTAVFALVATACVLCVVCAALLPAAASRRPIR
jgi:MFS family permease